MGYKSRSNYAPFISMSQERFDSIFGKKERKPIIDADIVDKKCLKFKVDYKDDGKSKELIKIGKEINRFKQLDGFRPKEVHLRFNDDCNRIIEKKPDKSVSQGFAREFVRNLNTMRG